MGKKREPQKVKEQLLSYEDYRGLPNDSKRYELADGVLEYWIIDPANQSLEQYLLASTDESYTYLPDQIYAREQTVHSARIPCVSFAMVDVMREIPQMLED